LPAQHVDLFYVVKNVDAETLQLQRQI
jgi:hypothetical protein